MKNIIIALIFIATALCGFGQTLIITEPISETEEVIVFPKIATQAGLNATAALKVDITDGVATNLTVPNLIYTATAAGTNYTATVTFDATNNVFIVTKAAE